jgi:hypothetical protein
MNAAILIMQVSEKDEDDDGRKAGNASVCSLASTTVANKYIEDRVGRKFATAWICSSAL